MLKRWQEDAISEAQTQCKLADPLAALIIRGFVSRSKGRGRQRRNWCRVILVCCPATEGRQFHILDKVPLDLYAVDLFGRECNQLDKRNYLRGEIERRAHGKAY